MNQLMVVTMEKEDLDVKAFVPETDKISRLQAEQDQILQIKQSSPLHGARLAIKDIFHVHGLTTSAGSILPVTALAGEMGPVVSKLLSAGCLNVGKTVTAEFAQYCPGPTRNPWDTSRSPGGSSSGSAAAVACGFCDIALGTQTMGSMIRPASFCGTIAIKPTQGRISRDGVIPCAPSFDQVGLFSRNIDFCERACSIICQGWNRQKMEVFQRAQKRVRVAIPEGPWQEKVDQCMLKSFDRFVDLLGTAPQLRDRLLVQRVDGMLLDHDEYLAQCDDLVLHEMAVVHETWFREHGELYSNPTRGAILRGQTIPRKRVEQCQLTHESLPKEMLRRWDSAECDFVLLPAALGIPPKFAEGHTGDPYMNFVWTACGFPVTTFPMDWVEFDGPSVPCRRLQNHPKAGLLPLGIQIVGRPHADEQLLSFTALLLQVAEEAERKD
eukprot:Rmarinus@m.21837